MADYYIGLDFGTSQSKVCVLNEEQNIREFIRFDNETFFLPSIIVEKPDGTFAYGQENAVGAKFRYFKMAAAEDAELIQVTNENLQGQLADEINDYRKYSTDFNISPENLVVLYLTYIYLYVKEEKNPTGNNQLGGLLGRLANNYNEQTNTFSINLGIPTEWHNPNHIQRKIKFQSLLLCAVKLSGEFQSLNAFLDANKVNLLESIAVINQNHVQQLEGMDRNEQIALTQLWREKYRISVFPESAAGVNYLLQTSRLPNGAYATLDIGAGTSDIAIFNVYNDRVGSYHCSESVEIASNDFYRKYAQLANPELTISFNEIKEAEELIRNNSATISHITNAVHCVRGYLNNSGIEFAIRKTFYRKRYLPLFKANQQEAFDLKNSLNKQRIIVFGGGANLPGFDNYNFCFYQGAAPLGNQDCLFQFSPVSDFINQVDIHNREEVEENINLLVLALGLSYKNDCDIGFNIVETEIDAEQNEMQKDFYFYYDLQSAAFG